MRRVVVTTLVLTFMLYSANAIIADICNYGYPPITCPKEGKSDWVKYGPDHCIKVFTLKLNFSDAENACIGHGGHLVSIHNDDESYQVACAVHRVKPRRQFYWIGLKLYFHYEDNLVFEWTDGTKLTFTAFAPGQPNFKNQQEECVEMKFTDFGGRWNDFKCSQEQAYICAVKF